MKNDKNNNHHRLKPKPKTKQIKNDKLNKAAIEIEIDKTKNDIVFPSFKSINYIPLIDKYSIQIPNYLKNWLISVLTMINNADLDHEIDAYSWMVLIYPSLILIKETIFDHTLIKLVNETIERLAEYMSNEAKLAQLSLNDILISIELFQHKQTNKIPKHLWNQLNKFLESTNTFNKFLSITCSRVKGEKLVKEILNCTSTQLIKNKTIYCKIREKWMNCISPYTQLCRIHRLYKIKETNKYLTKITKENINILCNEFDDKYIFVLRDLLIPIKQRTDEIKMDYPYYRYKTMAMCTHTATTIPATFAAYIGFIDNMENEEEKNNNNNNNIDYDISSLNCVMNALQDDVNTFIETVENIISQLKEQKISINIKNINKKIPKKQLNNLRLLDHICYNSICTKLMFESFSDMEQVKKLQEIRESMRNILDKLAKHSLLFCQEIDDLKCDILQSCFLVYDKQQKQTWSVHLMSGVLLNYWVKKIKS